MSLGRFALAATYAIRRRARASRSTVMVAGSVSDAMNTFRHRLSAGGNTKIDITAWPIDDEKEHRSHDCNTN